MSTSKNRVRWSIIILLLLGQTAQGQFEVLDIPASGTVYIACGEGHCMIADWDEFIGLTSNLGESFDTLSFPSSSYSVSGIQHTSDNTYYLVGMRTDTLQQTVIYKSLNTGQTWEHIFERPYSPHIFYMRTDSFGFVSTGLGALYRTMNGWQTYDITQYSIGTGLTSAYFLNDSVGFIGHKNGAMRSIDSGSNWNAGGFGSSSFFMHDFGQINDSTIIATAGTNSTNWIRIFRSIDEGATGKMILDIKNVRRISEIKCFPSGECIAVGKNTSEGKALLYRTLDGGDTWYEIEAPTSKMLYNIEFANDSIAFIGGEDGVLIRMNRNLLPPPPDTTEDTITVIDDVSFRGHDILIYPNPASSAQQIELNLHESSEVSHILRSIEGSLIRSQSFGELNEGKHTFRIDISNLPSGIYIHEIHLGQDRLIKRFTHL